MTDLTCLKSWELDIVLDGYFAAQKDQHFSQHAPDLWKAGFLFWLTQNNLPLPPQALNAGSLH